MEPTTDIPFPVQITFHGVKRTDALEDTVRGHVSQLPRFHPRIHGVRVVLSEAEGHHRTGNRYQVQVRVAIPGNDVVVSHHHPLHAEREDPFLTVSDTFRAVERRLSDELRLRRHDVKERAEGLLPGKVTRLPEAEDHGFLETADGREVYFHRNSVLDGRLEDLAVGAKVRFAEEEGEKGPQASTVHLE